MHDLKPSYEPPAIPEEDRLWLAGRIATLLRFYYQGDDDEALIEEQAQDWIEVLGIFPAAAIAAACRAYLIEEPRKRPTPGAVRALVVREINRDPRLLGPRKSLAAPSEAKEEREALSEERRREIMAEMDFSPERVARVLAGRRMPPTGVLYEPEPQPDPGRGATRLPPEAYLTPEEIKERGL